jgi:bifunctional pyridoxal-dependent enzyme with beta-cystathionase and maltose regulon repressor activities
LDAESQGSDSTQIKPLKGIILSSPSNPTGAMLTDRELQDMAQLCDERGTHVNEHIYLQYSSTNGYVLALVQSSVYQRLQLVSLVCNGHEWCSRCTEMPVLRNRLPNSV